jgi:hypothetical protein
MRAHAVARPIQFRVFECSVFIMRTRPFQMQVFIMNVKLASMGLFRWKIRKSAGIFLHISFICHRAASC